MVRTIHGRSLSIKPQDRNRPSNVRKGSGAAGPIRCQSTLISSSRACSATGDGKVDKKEQGDLFVVVVEKEASPLNIYAGPKGAKFAAHCMAEPDHKDLAMEICTSIKAAK